MQRTLLTLTQTSQMTHINHAVAAARRSARGLAALVLLFGSACSMDRILKVERPDIVEPGGLNNSNGVSALHAGVIGDLSNTMGQTLGVIAVTGLMTDELRFGATPPEIRQMDQRATPESNTLLANVYRNVQQLRGQADRAAAALKAASASDPRAAEMQAVSALAHVLLGEMFCNGVPLGVPGENASPKTNAEIFTAAATLAGTAVSGAGSDNRTKHLASIVRARALVDLGQFAEAATAVAGVPTDFSYTTLHSTTTDYQKNGVYDYMFNFDGLLVSDREGTNGMDFGTANDPRVPVEGDGSPSRFDGQTPRYYWLGAADFTAPMAIATGVEARLIEAEAALRGGSTANFIARLNVARSFFNMAGLTDPGTAAARNNLLFRERAFSLYLSGHRLGDLRRMVRQYSYPAESVYPTGNYHKDGLTLGTDIQMIVPQTEKNNPNFTGCRDRAA